MNPLADPIDLLWILPLGVLGFGVVLCPLWIIFRRLGFEPYWSLSLLAPILFVVVWVGLPFIDSKTAPCKRFWPRSP